LAGRRIRLGSLPDKTNQWATDANS